MHRLAPTIAIAAWSLLAISCGSNPSPSAPSITNATGGISTNPAPVPAPAPAPVVTSTFTFSIDSSCRSQFPESLQQRSYTGTSGGYAGVVSLGGDFERSAGVGWNVVYRSTRADSTYVGFNDPPLWEQLSAESYFLIYGYSEYQSTSEYGEWPFWGRVTFCAARKPGIYPECAVPEITCESTRHRLRVTRN